MVYSTSSTVSLVVVILAGFLPTQAHAESRQIELRPSQVYTNVPSQFQFPPNIATFQREPKFTQYDGEGRDIGVGYNDLSNSVAATVFVYPVAQRPPKSVFENSKKPHKSADFAVLF